MAQQVARREAAGVRQRRQPRRHGLVERERAALGQQAEQRGDHRLRRRGQHEAVASATGCAASSRPALADHSSAPPRRTATCAPGTRLCASTAATVSRSRRDAAAGSASAPTRTAAGGTGRAARHAPASRRARCVRRIGNPYAAAASSESAASTTSSWVLGDTFGNTLATVPSGAMRNVARCTPQ